MSRWPVRTVEQRFTEKYIVDPVTECWIWTAYTHKGYGRFRDGKTHDAHKWSYHHFIGPTPDGLVLDHFECDNRACVNPQHLKPVTNAANSLRGIGIPATNKRKTHCINGHEFNSQNTYTTTNADSTHRHCKRCRVDCEQRRRDRRKK